MVLQVYKHNTNVRDGTQPEFMPNMFVQEGLGRDELALELVASVTRSVQGGGYVAFLTLGYC